MRICYRTAVSGPDDARLFTADIARFWFAFDHMQRLSDTVFDQVVDEFGTALNRLARSYAANDADSDDLLQEIMLAIWRALPRFRGECTLRTFVFRIGHNRALTFVARRRLHEPIDRAAELADTRPGPAEDAERAERQERLLAAVRELPELQRQALILSFEGLSQREMADVLGSTENTIAVRLSRARATLRQMFAQKAEL